MISADPNSSLFLPPPLRGRVGEGGMPHAQVSRVQRGRAKQLRRAMTRAEVLLWRHLKAHRLAALGFRRQSPIGRYIADFVAHTCKLIVEVDGESHEFESRLLHDSRRDEWFASRGYRVLSIYERRCISKSGGCHSRHWAGRSASGTPLPNPPPQGGRERI